MGDERTSHLHGWRASDRSFHPINESEGALSVAVVSGVTINISGIDVQLGAVELKDEATNTRAAIVADGANNALFIQSNSLAKDANLSGVKSQTDKLNFVGQDLKVTVSGVDVEIGAVEIKDATSENRVIVSTSGQLYTNPGKISGEDTANDVMKVKLESGTTTTKVDIVADGAKNAMYVQSNSLASNTT